MTDDPDDWNGYTDPDPAGLGELSKDMLWVAAWVLFVVLLSVAVTR